MASFKDMVFPPDVSYGAISTLKYSTDVTMTQSGFEKRNANWLDPLLSFDVSHNIKTIEQALILKGFFITAKGMLLSFKFKDWTDYIIEKKDSVIGEADELLKGIPTYKLYKQYGFNLYHNEYLKSIDFIINDEDTDYNEFNIYDEKDEIFDKSLYSVDRNTGMLTFNPLKKFNVSTITKQTLNNVDYICFNLSSDHNLTDDDKILYVSNLQSESRLNEKTFNILDKSDKRKIIIEYKYSDDLVLNNQSSVVLSIYPQNKKFTFECEFYLKTRFSEDTASLTIEDYNSLNIPCKLVEVRD